MSTRTPTTIEALEDGVVELSDGVKVPARFRADFEGTVAITLEIEMVDRSPAVRSVTMSTTTQDLADTDLRQPLRSRLVPAAMAIACREQSGSPSDDGTEGAAAVDRSEQPRRAPRIDDSPDTTTDNVARGDATSPDRAERPSRASRNDDRGHTTTDDATSGVPTPVKRGRPRRVPDPDELEQVANAYLTHRSLSDVMSRFPTISKTTAWRRVNEARDADLIPTTPDSATSRSRSVQRGSQGGDSAGYHGTRDHDHGT